MGNDDINCTFEFKEPIIREEIYRISLNGDEQHNCTYFYEKNGNTLIISLKKSPSIKTYTFSVYPTYDSETISPLNLHIYFQDFFIHYEAVYANASAQSSTVSLLVDFENEMNSGFRFILEYIGSGQAYFENNGFSCNGNKNCYYNFTIYNPHPGIINIKKNDQIRPIFLITYQTNSNKCYLSETENEKEQTFEIIFFKTSEMEYAHSVFFKVNGYLIVQASNQNSTFALHTVNLKNLYQDTFYLYSRIPKLSSDDENPIDNNALNVSIYDDPY